MKLLIVLAVVASACAYSVDDIPEHVRARLDRFVALKKQWEEKWSSMTDGERNRYEQVMVDRLSHLPEIEKLRLREHLEALPEEHRLKLRDYMRRRYPQENPEENTFETDVDEIAEIMETLPKMIQEKIKETLIVKFQEATAYSLDENYDPELNLEEIPDLIDIPEAQGYSDSLPEELRERVDEFLLKRENWRRQWERIPGEKREALEAYINAKL